MTTTRVNTPNQNYRNPLGGFIGVCVFALLALLSISVAFIYCSDLISAGDDFKFKILHTYLVTIVIGWFSFTVSDDAGEFLVSGLLAAACFTVVIGMLHMWHPVFFWLGLAQMVALALIAVFSSVKTQGVWDRAFIGIYVVWVITGVVFLLGNARLLNYAQPALKFSTVHFLLDFRYLVTAGLIVVFVGKSVSDAFQEGAPAIPSLPDFEIPGSANKNASFFSLILSPVVIVINATLFVVQKITNAIWQVLATVGAYLIRIGVNLARYVLDIVLNSDIWISILKVSATFVVLIIITSLISYVGPGLVEQILREWWPYDLTAVSLKPLAAVAGTFLLTLILINTTCRLWELVEIPLPKSAFAAAMLMVAWALSGLLCFSITRFEIVKLRGFHSLGLYTLLFLLFIGSVFVFQLCYYVVGKIRQPEPTPQPQMATWAIGSIAIFTLLTVSLFWWIHARFNAQEREAEAVEVAAQRKREEKRALREQTRKAFLERGKTERKDVWQTAKIANNTEFVMTVSTSTDNGKTWRPIKLEPNSVVVLSARNSEITVVWDTDPSDRVSNKQHSLNTEAFFDRQPTAEEQQNGPINFFQVKESVVELLCID